MGKSNKTYTSVAIFMPKIRYLNYDDAQSPFCTTPKLLTPANNIKYNSVHYDYFEFRHTLSDEERVQFLHDAYERIMALTIGGTYRNINKVMRFLRTSDFYRIACRHHQFVGGNAWHQLETLCHAFLDPFDRGAKGYDEVDLYRQQRAEWLEADRFGIAVVCLLHDAGNVTGVDFPGRVLKRHGRRSTYVLTDLCRFDLMFDENMAIIYHQEKDPEALRYATPDEETFERILAFPLYRMIRHCDAISCTCRLTESELQSRLEELYTMLEAER